jgi:hypothetical protein
MGKSGLAASLNTFLTSVSLPSNKFYELIALLKRLIFRTDFFTLCCQLFSICRLIQAIHGKFIHLHRRKFKKFLKLAFKELLAVMRLRTT